MTEPSQPRRVRWLVIGVVVTLLLTGVAFVAGTQVRSDSEAAAANSRRSIEVTAVVEERTITARDAVVTGSVALGVAREVHVGAEGPAVVTGRGADPGSELAAGTAPVEVNSRPLVALRLPFDLFRDLVPGTEGSDVAAVQTALGELGLFDGAADGRYGVRTAAAVRALYTRIGSTPPAASAEASAEAGAATTALAEALEARTSGVGATDETGAPLDSSAMDAAVSRARDRLASATAAADTPLPAAEVLSLPNSTVHLVSVAEVGTDVSEVAVLAIRSGEPTVTARVPVSLAEQLAVGATAVVTAASDAQMTAPATVTAVSEFLPGVSEDGAPPGYDVTLRLGESSFEDAAIVVVAPDAAPPGTTGAAVPLVALREDGEGVYVVTGPGGEDRIEVTVLATGDGWAVVESQLQIGDLVRISG